METLDCNEIDYVILEDKNKDKSSIIKLNLPPITDDEFPTVSVVVPTYNRPEFFELIMRNWNRVEYPREKLEMIILDDTPKTKVPLIKDKQIRYYTLPKKISIGEKRNLLCNYAKNEYIVHMDDDDWYPPESIACRIRILLEYQKKIKQDACFGCTKVICLDLITNQTFEAFDSSIEGLPSTLSESTMAYSKKYWNKQKFQNDSKFAECLPFIKNRHDTVCSGPSVFVVTQFTHEKNTIQRRIEKTYISEYNYNQFENNLSVYDSKIFNNIRAKVIKKIPSYSEAIDFVVKFRNDTSLDKFKKEYNYLDEDVKANPLVINIFQEKMISKETSSGKDIVYYCGPGNYFKFNNKWNPESKQLGGSEEAVINLSKEFTNNGYNVTVYCVLSGKTKMYDNVMYKPYYEWIPKDVQDMTIIWRDPSNFKQIIHSKYMCLDLHDAINPDWLKDLDSKIKIMTKSNYHSKILNLDSTNSITIPNGIYNSDVNIKLSEKIENLMVCTSSPDRCLSALLRALPLIRKEIPDAQIHWAYGFTSSISGNGGMEKDPRTKKWVEEHKEIIKNTEGFVDLGRLSQIEINKLYKKADLFIYPTRFPEIDCISLSKAMLFGCIPVVTPSGAMAEKLGIDRQIAKLVNDKLDYSLEEGSEFDSWVKAIILRLKKTRTDEERKIISDYANEQYSWKLIVNKWLKYFET